MKSILIYLLKGENLSFPLVYDTPLRKIKPGDTV